MNRESLFRKNAAMIILFVVALLIKIFSFFPAAVETYYSEGIYPWISRIQRLLFGWIPFSIGDVLYAAAAIALAVSIARFAWRLAKRKLNGGYLLRSARRTVTIALLVYVWFNLAWGLNYNRPGIATQLQLKRAEFTKQELTEVMQQIAGKMNSLYPLAVSGRNELYSKRILFSSAIRAYDTLSGRLKEFEYDMAAVKPSLYSYLGNYLGFTGYYNPFTGEAQVNTTVPVYIRPFTTCHEIGHQLGYAKESEANFAGYLSARSSPDPSFRYSVYFDLYAYGRGYLYTADSMLLKKIDSGLNEGIKEDYRDLRRFIQAHQNPVEVLIDRLYSNYLRANEQPMGRISYNEVILLLMDYYRKYGRI